jgi:hypothetical protein
MLASITLVPGAQSRPIITKGGVAVVVENGRIGDCPRLKGRGTRFIASPLIARGRELREVEDDGVTGEGRGRLHLDDGEHLRLGRLHERVGD